MKALSKYSNTLYSYEKNDVPFGTPFQHAVLFNHKSADYAVNRIDRVQRRRRHCMVNIEHRVGVVALRLVEHVFNIHIRKRC